MGMASAGVRALGRLVFVGAGRLVAAEARVTLNAKPSSSSSSLHPSAIAARALYQWTSRAWVETVFFDHKLDKKPLPKRKAPTVEKAKAVLDFGVLPKKPPGRYATEARAASL